MDTNRPMKIRDALKLLSCQNEYQLASALGITYQAVQYWRKSMRSELPHPWPDVVNAKSMALNEIKPFLTDGRTLATDRRKHECRKKVREAILSGKLKKLDGTVKCVDCGAKATCYDHRDYAKPLMVDAVCKKCDAKRGPGAVPESWGHHKFSVNGPVIQQKQIRRENDEKVLRMHKAGLSNKEIAEIFDWSRQRVHQVLSRAKESQR